MRNQERLSDNYANQSAKERKFLIKIPVLRGAEKGKEKKIAVVRICCHQSKSKPGNSF